MKKIHKVWSRLKYSSSDNLHNESNCSPFDQEITKFVNSNSCEDFNYILLLDFLLDVNNVNLNKSFVEFCKEIHCYENVEFVNMYKEYKKLTIYNEIVQKCIVIYNLFIKDDADKQLNLYHKITVNIEKIILQKEKNIDDLRIMYDPVLIEVKQILVGNTLLKFLEKTNLTDFISDSRSSSSRSISTSSDNFKSICLNEENTTTSTEDK